MIQYFKNLIVIQYNNSHMLVISKIVILYNKIFSVLPKLFINAPLTLAYASAGGRRFFCLQN